MEETSSNGYNENILKNINSNYILENVFGYLNENKLLQIIKYNSYLKKILNKDINDYKRYTQIELEIIAINLEDSNVFINLVKKDKQYYHIYFNDEKKEINNNFFLKNKKVNKIRITIDYPINSFQNLFQYCKCIKKITFIKFNRNNIIDMSYMFQNCESLEVLNFIKFNTDRVIDMSSMFENCKSLKELNLINFNTNKVENMKSMFRGVHH